MSLKVKSSAFQVHRLLRWFPTVESMDGLFLVGITFGVLASQKQAVIIAVGEGLTL